MRNLSLAALALVIFQGVLGGMRVLLDERTLAMLHGCTGPLFFALTVAMVVFTSKTLAIDARSRRRRAWPRASIVRRLAVATCVLAYLQLVFGAVLRHVPVDSEPRRISAGRAIPFVPGRRADAARRRCSRGSCLRTSARCGRSTGLALALCGADRRAGAAGRRHLDREVRRARLGRAIGCRSTDARIQADGWLQTHVITAHVAVGSLLLVTSRRAGALCRCGCWRRAGDAARASDDRDDGGGHMTRITTQRRFAIHCLDAASASGWLARLGDFVELTKPRIVVLELVTVVVAAHLGVAARRRRLGAVAHGARRGARGRQRRRVQSMARSDDRRPHAPHRDRGRCRPAGSPPGRSSLFGAGDARRRRALQLLVFVNPLTAGCGARHLARLRVDLHAAQNAHRRSTRPSAR